MPTTPILGIQQVSPNQSQKEVTINDAILQLESATNGTYDVDFAATATVTLSVANFTGFFLFNAGPATADVTLKLPDQVNGLPSSRLFVVRNSTGHGLTTEMAAGTGASVIIPDGEARLLAVSAGDVIVAAEPATVVAFVALTDVPHSYTGKAGQALVVTEGEDGMEFVGIVNSLSSMTDVDLTTTPPTNGKVLEYNGSKWVPATLASAATTFLALTDTPSSYTGSANFFLRVNGAGNGVEFISINQVPTSGSEGQVLTKGTGSAYAWDDPSSGGGGGIPDGGTTGQVLTKISDDDGDAGWADATGDGGGGGTTTETIIVAVSDEATALTTGTAKVTFRMPYAFTLTDVRASLTTASSADAPTIDINEGGVTILSTKLSIDSGEKTSKTAATAAVISDASLADDAEITIDIDAAGTGSTGLKVYLIGHQ